MSTKLSKHLGVAFATATLFAAGGAFAIPQQPSDWNRPSTGATDTQMDTMDSEDQDNQGSMGSHGSDRLGQPGTVGQGSDTQGAGKYQKVGSNEASGKQGKLTGTLARKVQQQLKDKGYYTAQVDGIIGPKSKQAIREFQRAQGLAPTGFVDGQTAQELGLSSADVQMVGGVSGGFEGQGSQFQGTGGSGAIQGSGSDSGLRSPHGGSLNQGSGSDSGLRSPHGGSLNRGSGTMGSGSGNTGSGFQGSDVHPSDRGSINTPPSDDLEEDEDDSDY